MDSEIEKMSLEEKIDMINKFNKYMNLSSITELICGGTALSMELYYIYKEALCFLRDSSHELDVKDTVFVSALVFANVCLSISQGLATEECRETVKKLEKSIKE